MQNVYSVGVFFLLFLIAFGCSGKENSNNEEEINLGKTISPKETATIIASIVSIDETKMSVDKNSPCSKRPCWAEVKIENIRGRGQGGPSLNQGDTVTVNFKFTLSETTEELIPNLDKRMPGLSIGDKFNANIRLLSEINSNKLYTIYYYTKI